MNSTDQLIYKLFVLGTTTYLVAEKGWSPWWFLVAMILMADFDD